MQAGNERQVSIKKKKKKITIAVVKTIKLSFFPRFSTKFCLWLVIILLTDREDITDGFHFLFLLSMFINAKISDKFFVVLLFVGSGQVCVCVGGCHDLKKKKKCFSPSQEASTKHDMLFKKLGSQFVMIVTVQ